MHRAVWFCCVVTVSAASAHQVETLPDGGTAAVFQESEASPEDAGTAAAAVPQAAPFQTTVTARRAYAAASSSTVRNEDFATRPISDPSDILEVTPGLLTVQHAGGGKANQYFLRGFDIDHGTDLALSVDGLPVNMVSHAHGQGYADMHFVIPEAIQKIEVTKGPYNTEQGDFATAGAVNLVGRRSFEESSVSVGYGTFNTFRALGIAAPQFDESVQTYLVGEVYGSSGPFKNPEGLRRFNLLGRASYLPSANTELTIQLQAYGSGWNASGQIPQRAVDAGTLDRFGSVDPTEGGNSQRHSASLAFHHHSPEGDEVRLRAYFLRYQLDLFSNFTFFAEDPINGDQIEQTDARNVIGFDGSYLKVLTWRGIDFKTRFGIQLRNDSIDTGLHHTVARERLEARVDAKVSEGMLGLYAEEDTQWTSWLRSVIGVRGDYLGVQVADRLEDRATSGNRTSGFTQAVLVSPKASLVVSPANFVDLFVNFGRGFHSNDARGMVREVQPVTPMAAATGYEVGVRARPFKGFDVAASAWALDLESEVVWVGDEGTTEARPATRRKGIEFEVRYRFTPWLRADIDFTYTHARFAEDSGAGTLVPLAPVWTWAGGIRVDHPIGIFGSIRVQGLSNRPANEDGSLVAQGFTLLDLEVGYQMKHFRVAVDVRNLLNSRWRQAQFANESRLSDEPAPVSDLHFTSGYPLSLMGTVTALF